MRHAFVVSIAMVISAAGVLPAQQRSRVSVDFGLGGGSGYSTAAYRDRSGFASELTLAVRRNPDRQTTQVWALAAGTQGVCVFLNCGEYVSLDQGFRNGYLAASLCLSGPYGEPCPPTFPKFAHAAMLGGVERHGTFTVRLLAGPSWYAISDGASGAGAQARLDVAGGFSHLQLMIWGRTSQVYRFNGERFTLNSVGAGFRIQ